MSLLVVVPFGYNKVIETFGDFVDYCFWKRRNSNGSGAYLDRVVVDALQTYWPAIWRAVAQNPDQTINPLQFEMGSRGALKSLDALYAYLQDLWEGKR